MAAGTGKVIADIMSQRPPEISIAGFAIDRYKTE
jgi:glycine/D-amino acid oxidase-like deaminating enzyme